MGQERHVTPEPATAGVFGSGRTPAEGAGAQPPLRLLLLEDDPGDVRLTMALFAKTGIQAQWAHASRLADVDLDTVCDRADCAIVDLGLPDSHGLEVVSRILKRAPQLPIVVLSGSTDRDLALAAVRSGAQDYLIKGGFQADTFGKTVRYAIERKLLERQLQQAEQLARLGRLVGGIAHHFNNQLAVVGNYTDFVAGALAAVPPGEADRWQEARDDVQSIRRATQQAADLTRQLMIFAEQDAVDPQVIELDAVIEDAAGLLADRLGNGIALQMSLDRALAPVLADRGHIQHLLTCLIDNARDAMPDGGRLVISTSGGPPVGPAGSGPACGYVRLRVRDTGTGIRKDIIDNVFDPFFTTKPVGQGVGLGLAAVRSIVNRWGGLVDLQSVPGTGTTVTMLFPEAPGHGGRITIPR